jgi:hypothetical protein
MSKIITPMFRGSFVHLNEPHAMKGVEGAKPKYSITVVIPKADPFWAKVDKLVNETAMAKWGKIPPKLKTPVRDGDEEGRPETAGMSTFNASSMNRPGVVDANLQPVIDPEEIYSGAYYRASIRAFAWEVPTGKGVSIALDNVQKVKDGEKFSGRTDAASDFADFGAEAQDDILA